MNLNPHDLGPDEREQRRLRVQAAAHRDDTRRDAAARFGHPLSQADDRSANVASLPPRTQASIAAEFGKDFH